MNPDQCAQISSRYSHTSVHHATVHLTVKILDPRIFKRIVTLRMRAHTPLKIYNENSKGL